MDDKGTAELKNSTHLSQFLKILIPSEKLFLSRKITRIKHIWVVNKPTISSVTCFVGIIFEKSYQIFFLSFESIQFLELIELSATLKETIYAKESYETVF